MDDVAISISIASLAVMIFCAYGILPVLKILLLCAFIFFLLYLLLMTDSAFPSDLLYQYLNPAKSRQAPQKEDGSHDHDDQITKKLRKLSSKTYDQQQPDDFIELGIVFSAHIVQDFIFSWYQTVSDDVSFVQNAFEVFEHIFVHSRQKISGVDKEKLLDLIIVEFMEHVVSYKKAMEKVDAKFVNR